MDTETRIRTALATVDREEWKPARSRDTVKLKGERFQAEFKGQAYNTEAVAAYLSAVSPSNIAELMAEISRLKSELEIARSGRGYEMTDEEIQALSRISYRAVMHKKNPAF